MTQKCTTRYISLKTSNKIEQLGPSSFQRYSQVKRPKHLTNASFQLAAVPNFAKSKSDLAFPYRSLNSALNIHAKTKQPSIHSGSPNATSYSFQPMPKTIKVVLGTAHHASRPSKTADSQAASSGNSRHDAELSSKKSANQPAPEPHTSLHSRPKQPFPRSNTNDKSHKSPTFASVHSKMAIPLPSSITTKSRPETAVNS